MGSNCSKEDRKNSANDKGIDQTASQPGMLPPLHAQQARRPRDCLLQSLQPRQLYTRASFVLCELLSMLLIMLRPFCGWGHAKGPQLPGCHRIESWQGRAAASAPLAQLHNPRACACKLHVEELLLQAIRLNKPGVNTALVAVLQQGVARLPKPLPWPLALLGLDCVLQSQFFERAFCFLSQFGCNNINHGGTRRQHDRCWHQPGC